MYRYVVFKPRKQPTVQEIEELKSVCEAVHFRYAAGVNAADGGLALAFPAREFEAARSTKPEFARLLEHWAVRGSEVRPKLLFIKRPDALEPIPGEFIHEPAELHGEAYLRKKQNAAYEAIGAASLRIHRTLERNAWVQRVAKVVPYGLMLLGAVMTIWAGFYAYQRLQDSRGERRQETIERVAIDAMEEPLSRDVEKD